MGYEYRPLVFQVGADYWHMSAVMVDYIVKEKGLKKWGVFYQDDDYGKDVLNGTRALKNTAWRWWPPKHTSVAPSTSLGRWPSCARRASVVMLGTVYREGHRSSRKREDGGMCKPLALPRPPRRRLSIFVAVLVLARGPRSPTPPSIRIAQGWRSSEL